jgi:helix-turn-helix protein
MEHNSMSTATKPQLLTNSEAAEFIRVTPGTLEVWRSEKRYEIPYTKVGGKILYDASDLLDWLASRKVRPGGRELQEV